MPAKKKLSVIALDPGAGESYRSDIAGLFGEAAEVSFRWSELRKLKELPAGSRVLFVNMTQTMAREAIA